MTARSFSICLILFLFCSLDAQSQSGAPKSEASTNNSEKERPSNEEFNLTVAWEKLTQVVKDWLGSKVETKPELKAVKVEKVEKPISEDVLRRTKEEFKKPILKEVSKAIEPDQSLVNEAAPVPKYPVFSSKEVIAKDGTKKRLYRIKKILPKLQVGRERRIKKQQLVGPELKILKISETDISGLPTPEPLPEAAFSGWKTLAIKEVEKAKVDKGLTVDMIKPFDRSALDNWKVGSQSLPEVKEKPYKVFSAAELKMLSALILYARGDQCDLVIGLFDQLQKESPSLAKEARFHLARCSQTKKLYSKAVDLFLQLIREGDPVYLKDSIAQLGSDLPIEFEKSFYQAVKPYLKNQLKSESFSDVVFYRLAKGAFRSGSFDRSIELAKKIEEASAYFWEGHYLLAINYFTQGKTKLAISKLEGIWALLNEKKIDDKNLRSLVAVNLARMKYNSGVFDQAEALFREVDKSHPLWVQALIEQGWAQIQQQDFSGAIGNMYSLHSPYFKSVYMPDSFAVRAIGYLNICQFGDAYRTISELEVSYREWKNKMAVYSTSYSDQPDHLRQTTLTYLKGASDKDVSGLPHQVIRELARQKVFLNEQKIVNSKEDELAGLAGVLKKIAEEKNRIRWRLKESEQRFTEVSDKLLSLKEKKGVKKDLNNLLATQRLEREFILGYKYQLALLDFSGLGYQAFRKSSETIIAEQKKTAIERLRVILAKNFEKLREQTGLVLDNNEFLRYEVFAGSGENIRYQAAGGDVKGAPARIPANIKPEKILNWSFSGEYWEDEIGSYRSSLKNLCPEALAEATQNIREGK